MALPVTPGGEFAREYNFYFVLYPNPVSSVKKIISLFKGGTNAAAFLQNLVKITTFLADTATQAYISTLAKKISPPAQVISTDQIDIGGIQIAVPKQYQINTFKVEYLDDKLHTVRNFHTGWLNSIRNGWNFELLSLVSLSCVFGDAIREPETGMDIPSTVNNFPQIFPINVSYSDLDKYGTELQVVSVEYLRIPLITESKVFSKVKGIMDTVKAYISLN